MARIGGEPPRERKHRTTARVRRARRRILKPIVALAGGAIFRFLSFTWRRILSADDPSTLEFDSGGAFLLVFWHGRAFPVLRAMKGLPAAVLVSPSKDGELSMAVLRQLGYPIIVGSSSRGGARAMKEMIRTLRGGMTIAITPDGPRGPIHSITDGVAFLAHMTGYPVVPVGIHVERAWRMPSWDRFTVPKPFARIHAHMGAPIPVPRRISEEEVRALTPGIREAMLTAEREAARRAGAEPEV